MGSSGYSKSESFHHNYDYENQQNAIVHVFLNVQTQRSWILSVLRGKESPNWIREPNDNRNSGTSKLFISYVILMSTHFFYLNI